MSDVVELEPVSMTSNFVFRLLLNRNGGLITSTMPVTTNIKQTTFINLNLSLRNIAAIIVVGIALLNIIVIASPKGINVTAMTSVVLDMPPIIAVPKNKRQVT